MKFRFLFKNKRFLKTQTCFPLLHLRVNSTCAADSAVNRASLVEYDVTLNCGASQFSARGKTKILNFPKRKIFTIGKSE